MSPKSQATGAVEPNIFILSAPSGTGKSTLVRRVIASRASLCLVVSHTTRPPRPGERDGREYHFVDRGSFERMVAEDGFVEWAEVHGNLYGTSRGELMRHLEAGNDVICEIDIQGAAAVRLALPEAVSIFLLPPSWSALEARLRGRRTETDEVVSRRLVNAHRELEQAPEFDYVVVNDDLEEATEDLLAVLRAAPLAQSHQTRTVEVILASRAHSFVGADS